jgi:hypothetical protein
MLLTRPPRFGKSVFCEMLGTYVDCKTTDDVFEQCFAGTKIERMLEEGDMATCEALTKLRRKCAWLKLVRMSLAPRGVRCARLLMDLRSPEY